MMTYADKRYDVLIVGAGFTGLYMLYQTRKLGLTARVLEAGGDVGGTRYWNCYPGARCDIESMEYSYEFDKKLQQEWEWPERYSAQKDIQNYIAHVADRHNLRSDIQFNTRIAGATYADANNVWTVKTEGDEIFTCTYLVAATGCVSAPLDPDFKGLKEFGGETYHTGKWPHHEVGFSGKRVAVIGTGSSGLQCIPEIAKQAAHLTVYQRTPAYSVPAQNRMLTPEEVEQIKVNYNDYRDRGRQQFFAAGAGWTLSDVPMSHHSPEKRREMMEIGYAHGGLAFIALYPDAVVDLETNRQLADFLREKISARVEDPKVAARLMPRGVLGAKRLCADTNYYETFNRDNVSLIDVRETPIEQLTEKGIQTTVGEEAYDVIVFATGYDALTGALTRMDIRGLNGVTIQEKWQHGAETYMGMMVAGFPNLFIPSAGVGNSAAFTHAVKTLEFSVEWISNCLLYMRGRGKQRIEPTQAAQDTWTNHVAEVASMTLFVRGDSWYNGANVVGKQKRFLPYVAGFPEWTRQCTELAEKSYEGFDIA